MEYHPLPPTSTEEKKTTQVPGCPAEVLSGSDNYKLKAAPYVQSLASSGQPSSPNWFYLTPEQIQSFRDTGFLLVKAKDIWTADELKLILDSSNQIDEWADKPFHYMKYYETSSLNQEKIMCRIENFVQYSAGMNYVCNGAKLMDSTSALLGEQAILYKEKINYKLPGAAGFVCHQDVAAGWWMYGNSIHLSVLVCVDPATTANGCLEISERNHNRGMLCEPWKEITKETEDSMTFFPVETDPGDVIFFDSYVPHRSAPNVTSTRRRVLYATYAKASEGDFRDKYYADKRVSYPPDCERLPGQKYEYKV